MLANKTGRLRHRNRKFEQVTPDYFLAKDAQFANGKIIGRKHAEATVRNMKLIETQWQKHCAFMKVNPDAHLEEGTSENFRQFLNWLLHHSNIRKKSSLWVTWKFLRLVHRRKVGRQLDLITGQEIADYIEGPLTDEYELDLSVRSKPVLGVDDLLVLFHYHWAIDAAIYPHERQRIQLSLLVLIIAYTSSRPGALIEGGCHRGTNEALCYKDIQVLVIPNPDQPDRNVIVMEVTLLFMKGQRQKSKPTIYLFHERDDNLVLCPILQFLALAFADNAFEAKSINSVADIFQLSVKAPRNSLHLKWKPSILNTPVFRQTVRTRNGIRICPNKSLTYDTFVKYLRRLGENAGFSEPLTPYCIRRGTANAVDDVATTAERNQVLGHSRSDIFDRYYISQRVKRDVQSAYLGVPAQTSLIRAVGKMSLSRDPRAPKELTSEKRLMIATHPRVVELSQQMKTLSAEIRSTGTIKKAKGTEIYSRYLQISKELASERKFQRSLALKQLREEFFDTIDTIEIEQQLSQQQLFQHEHDTAEQPCLKLEQRSRLAKSLISFSAINLDPDQIRCSRSQAMSDLVALCALREPPRLQTANFKMEDIEDIKDIEEPELFPISCPATQCLFCLGDDHLSYAARTFSFSRVDHLRRHVKASHLTYISLNEKFSCPHPVCNELLEGVDHFKSHAATVHNIFH